MNSAKDEIFLTIDEKENSTILFKILSMHLCYSSSTFNSSMVEKV